MPQQSPRPPRRRTQQAGFSLLEVMIGGIILSIGLLGHVASTLTEHRLARQERVRSQMLHVVRQFMERLRSEEDWAGLGPRVRTLQELAALPGNDGVRLEDGRRAWALQSYCPDLVLSPRLGEVGVLVELPETPAAPGVLREDADLPRFGLPADLNGDGEIDDAPHDDDYVVLPVVVTFCWQPPGEARRQLSLHSWLRGDR